MGWRKEPGGRRGSLLLWIKEGRQGRRVKDHALVSSLGGWWENVGKSKEGVGGGGKKRQPEIMLAFQGSPSLQPSVSPLPLAICLTYPEALQPSCPFPSPHPHQQGPSNGHTCPCPQRKTSIWLSADTEVPNRRGTSGVAAGGGGGKQLPRLSSATSVHPWSAWPGIHGCSAMHVEG